MRVELPLASAGPWIRVPFAAPAWLSLRDAGDMRSRAARARLFGGIGVDPARVVMLRQIHSRLVHHADALLAAGSTAANAPDTASTASASSRAGTVTGAARPDSSAALLEGDGIVSGAAGAWLAVGVADCMPIYLYDPVTGAYGLLHSGWKGTGILEAGVRALEQRYGVRPADLVVLLGPCISARSYEVDARRGEEYRRWGAEAVVHEGNRTYLDMRAANIGLARSLGVENVGVVDHCTFLTPELASFRRQGTDGYTGMLAMIGPEPHRLPEASGAKEDA
ncbi:MAG: laccase domain-containing protein [Spirochaetota bacterium]